MVAFYSSNEIFRYHLVIVSQNVVLCVHVCKVVVIKYDMSSVTVDVHKYCMATIQKMNHS